MESARILLQPGFGGFGDGRGVEGRCLGGSGVSRKIRTRGPLAPAGLNLVSRTKSGRALWLHIAESYVQVLHKLYSYLFLSKEIWEFQQRIATAFKENRGIDRHHKSVHGFPIWNRTNVPKSVNFFWLFKVS